MNAEDEPGHRLPGAQVQRVVFVAQSLKSGDAGNQQVIVNLPPAIGRRAIALAGPGEDLPPGATHELAVLTLATEPGKLDAAAQGQTLALVRAWADVSGPTTPPPCLPMQSLLMTLQGAEIVWNRRRLAILAPVDRLESVRRALVETSYYEAELQEIEQTLTELWPQLEADMPLAFDFSGQTGERRDELRQRFLQIALLRARWARIGAYVHCPHLHPPTLASQVAERLRERTQVVHRHDYLDEQLEVFEDVYEQCGERANDAMLARSGHMLEWIIIILLGFQLLMSGFEMLTRSESASVEEVESE